MHLPPLHQSTFSCVWNMLKFHLFHHDCFDWWLETDIESSVWFILYEKKAPPYMEQLQKEHCMNIKNFIGVCKVQFQFYCVRYFNAWKKNKIYFQQCPICPMPNAIVLLNERDLRIQDICFYKTIGIIISDIDWGGK